MDVRSRLAQSYQKLTRSLEELCWFWGIGEKTRRVQANAGRRAKALIKQARVAARHGEIVKSENLLQIIRSDVYVYCLRGHIYAGTQRIEEVAYSRGVPKLVEAAHNSFQDMFPKDLQDIVTRFRRIEAVAQRSGISSDDIEALRTMLYRRTVEDVVLRVRLALGNSSVYSGSSYLPLASSTTERSVRLAAHACIKYAIDNARQLRMPASSYAIVLLETLRGQLSIDDLWNYEHGSCGDAYRRATDEIERFLNMPKRMQVVVDAVDAVRGTSRN